MSPRSFAKRTPQPVLAPVRRLWLEFGLRLRDARLARRWSVQKLSDRAGVSRAVVYLVEGGRSASTETALRLASALGLRLDLQLLDPRRADKPPRSADPVHAAMGEVQAAHLRRLGYRVGVDEPYQHYQFAGRADVTAWDGEHRAFLHLENRTRFPDFQEMAGSYNAKRAYLSAAIASRLGIRIWASETHVIVALWSAEVLHSLRLRPESFRSICPDPVDAFAEWWRGSPPHTRSTSSLIVFDPIASGRQRQFVALDEALSVRPRHRGYADAAARLIATGGPR
jgi:transcriptional regulator with XRE-family HTH domain